MWINKVKISLSQNNHYIKKKKLIFTQKGKRYCNQKEDQNDDPKIKIKFTG